MTSGQTASNGACDEAFRALENDWESDDAHRRFLAFCSTRGELAEAGRLYRAVRDSDPSRRDEASKRLAAILAAAFATLDASRARTTRKRARIGYVAAGALLVLLAYALLAVLRRFDAFR